MGSDFAATGTIDLADTANELRIGYVTASQTGIYGKVGFCGMLDYALSDEDVARISDTLDFSVFYSSNDTPYLIGASAVPPLDFDETAQIAATATVTAAETYTPPVAPSYDETAQIAASVTITALETYTPPAGTDNNVWVGADRLDALAVGATVLDQAYVGTVPVLNQ